MPTILPTPLPDHPFTTDAWTTEDLDAVLTQICTNHPDATNPTYENNYCTYNADWHPDVEQASTAQRACLLGTFLASIGLPAHHDDENNEAARLFTARGFSEDVSKLASAWQQEADGGLTRVTPWGMLPDMIEPDDNDDDDDDDDL